MITSNIQRVWLWNVDDNETKQDSGQDAGAPLGDDDFENGEDLAYIASGMKDAIEKETMYEGEHMRGDLESVRGATTDPSHLWPRGVNGKPTVPYTISSTFTASDRATIAKGLKIIERLTCLRYPKSKYLHTDKVICNIRYLT